MKLSTEQNKRVKRKDNTIRLASENRAQMIRAPSQATACLLVLQTGERHTKLGGSKLGRFRVAAALVLFPAKRQPLVSLPLVPCHRAPEDGQLAPA